MTSLWLDRDPIPGDHVLAESYDDVVVGAGLTGLVTAVLLARAGRSVAVIEAREIGAVTTGNTTGKVSLLQGTRLSRILERQSREVAEGYVEGNREGMAWLLRFCEDHGVPVQARGAATYATDTGASQRQARAELDAAASLGLPVRWVDDLGTPFPSYGGVVLADQAQLDPLDVLTALTAELRSAEGVVVTGRRVVRCSLGPLLTLTLDDATQVRCEHVVQATGAPILDRDLYFARLEPQRSYALAFDHPDEVPVMLLSAGSPTRSVRDAPRAGGSRLLIGGQGHTVGRTPSEAHHLDVLREWTAQYFPGATETHAWSAQDYSSPDGVPYLGPTPNGGGRVFAATGYAKWGMTNAVTAARSISARILGQPTSWAAPLERRATRPSSALEIARLNAAVAVRMASGLARAELRAPDDVAEGEGSVGRRGVLPVGRARVDSRSCGVVALCTHLGGTLKWNDAEQSWDCPLHGSRFAPDGRVLEGPATRALRRADGTGEVASA